jgi:glycosyltransferase involved in cell wall biosynthesis
LGIAESVTFTGAVSHDRVPELLRAMDVAVAPFRRMEGFYFSPIKLFEYMASGTCVIASRLGQISQVIEDGSSGLLCEPDDISDLHAKLQRVRQSVDLRERLANRALRVVRQHHTWRHAAERTCEITQRAIENRRNAPAPLPPETVGLTASMGALR